jgi:predicted dehydrogenase
MGFGQAVYQPVLTSLGHQVITVDPHRPADFVSVEQALDRYKFFDTVNITTPNYTHEALARQLAPHCKILFVEKPGVVNRAAWHKLVFDHPNTNIMMTKNNQYREQVPLFRELFKRAETVTVKWSNRDRIPNPGSWFTNRKLAYGGVSRDLMPHLLSWYTLLGVFEQGLLLNYRAEQRWQLSDLTHTDYGSILADGVFDVDTYCELEYESVKTRWRLIADWRSSGANDEVYIEFDGVRHDLGLCPEIAYKNMIQTAIDNSTNLAFWEDQLAQDLFIHQEIEIE